MEFSKFVAKPNGRLTFQLSNIPISVANSLRRIILSEIPNVAFHFDCEDPEDSKIHIVKNNTSFHNEFLAQRISLIPIYLTKEEIRDYDSTRWTYKIERKNESNMVEEVTSADIQVYDIDNKRMKDEFRARLFPKDPITKEHILLTRLEPNLGNNKDGNSIEVNANAVKGIAKQHACFGVVSLCVYEELKEKDQFLFKMKTTCGLSCQTIFKQALEILIEKLEAILFKIKEIHEVEGLSGVGGVDESGIPTFIIENENHTAANLIQAMLYDYYIGDTLEYIGYTVPHPLQNNVLLKVKSKDNKKEKEIIDLGIKRVILYLKKSLTNFTYV